MERAFKEMEKRYDEANKWTKEGLQKFYFCKALLQTEYDQFLPEWNQYYKDIRDDDIIEYFIKVLEYNQKNSNIIGTIYGEIKEGAESKDPVNEMYCLFEEWIYQLEYSREKFAKEYNIHLKEIEHNEDNLSSDRAIRMYYWGNEMREAFNRASAIWVRDIDDSELNYMRKLLLEENFNKKIKT